MALRLPSMRITRFLSVAVTTAVLTACASSPRDQEYEKNYQNATNKQHLLAVEKSFLRGEAEETQNSSKVEEADKQASTSSAGFKRLDAMQRNDVSFSSASMAQNFSDSELVRVSANNMALKDYLHYVFGDLLKVNYLLTPEVNNVNTPVTLNLGSQISKRKLFNLSQTILTDRNIALKYNGDVYVMSKLDPNSKASKVVGVGRSVEDIPQGSDSILQVIPVLYGIKTTLKRTIEQLSDVTVTLDARQSAVFVEGKRAAVARALELIQLLDSPANRGRHIGMVKLTFSTIDLYLQQISVLLENEGIPNSIADPQNNNLVFVPLYQIGAVAVFAASDVLLDRVEYWTKTIDQPSEGDVSQYYVFHPRYARAKDIGESLQPLISGVASTKTSSNARLNNADAKGESTGQLKSAARKTGASNNDLTFVVDERTNALIFYTTGTNYKSILPLVNSLDVLPKQVMLNITIAEVTLTDQFKFGVDYALSGGNFGFNTGFGATKLGGGGLQWFVGNGVGADKITAQAFKQNKLVNVLSNPSLLVRDGVSANIQVGTDLPVVGSTTTDPVNGTTRSVGYRQTGTSVTVTPTINAQGVVIMNISQTSSNQVDGGAAVEGNPQVFERSLTTEVVAESGQTIIMGGLISENVSDTDDGLPVMRDLPIVGTLFGATTQETVKTELVLLVTPRVISRTDQWDSLMDVFRNSIDNIRID